VIVAGTWVAIAASPATGGVIITIDVIGLGGVFIYGTQARKQERIEKTQLMTKHLTRGRGQVGARAQDVAAAGQARAELAPRAGRGGR